MARIARIQITGELMRLLLHLPVETVVLRSNQCDQDIEIVVEDPNLPDVSLDECERPPLVRPRFRRNEDVTFINWGL